MVDIAHRAPVAKTFSWWVVPILPPSPQPLYSGHPGLRPMGRPAAVPICSKLDHPGLAKSPACAVPWRRRSERCSEPRQIGPARGEGLVVMGVVMGGAYSAFG